MYSTAIGNKVCISSEIPPIIVFDNKQPCIKYKRPCKLPILAGRKALLKDCTNNFFIASYVSKSLNARFLNYNIIEIIVFFTGVNTAADLQIPTMTY